MNKLFLTLAIVLVFVALATADIEGKKNKNKGFKVSAETKASFNSCKSDCDDGFRACKQADLNTSRECRYERASCRHDCVTLHEAQIASELATWEATQSA